MSSIGKITTLLLVALGSTQVRASENIEQLESRLAELEQQIQTLKQQQNNQVQANSEVETSEHEDGITIGGAVRFQYTWSGYDEDNRDRGGDLDFNIFRLDFDGRMDNFILSAQYRWYDYMDVVHHAWVGYELNEQQMLKLGIQEVAFGNFPNSANSFFYSTAFFVGIQADFDTGLNWTYDDGEYRVDLGYYFNDELGGVDGWVEDRKDRYSFDVLGIRLEGEGIFDEPEAELGEANTVNLRVAKKFTAMDAIVIEPGISFQQGDLSQKGDWDEIEGLGQTKTSVGQQSSWAVHFNIDWQQLNVQSQYASYEYEIDNMAVEQFVVGSYNFYGSIPASADAWLLNLSWTESVNWGPIKKVRFFNDYSRLTNKSGKLDDTWMNSTGAIISAGPIYTYVEYFMAKNQPFIGGNLVGNASDSEQRLNLNVGYYF